MVFEWSRRDILRGSLLAGAAVAMPSAMTGCTALGFGSTLEDIRSAGVIRAGIAGEVPYSFVDGDTLTGAIGDLHRVVFERLGGIRVEPVLTSFSALLDGLDKGNFDIVAAGMFLTEQRCGQALFSEPVYCAPTALLVAAGNPMALTDFASIAETGATVAVLGAAVEGDYAEASGVASEKITTVSTQVDGLELVARGEVDALALTAISLRSLLDRVRSGEADLTALPGGENTGKVIDQVETTDPFTVTIDGEELMGCGGAGFRSNDTELRDAFNTELSSLRESGELLELLAPWGFTETEIPPADVTAEILCSTGGISEDVKNPVPR